MASTLEEDEPLPAADVTKPTNPTDFDADYKAASLSSGVCTHLVLDNGDYGNKTLRRNKAGATAYGQGKPIVIRTANANGRPDAVPTAANSALFSALRSMAMVMSSRAWRCRAAT